ncbi:MAG: hypothetical protein LBB45_05405 [Methanobrevibacter sp.]|jgi:hypothetical protein|nr:hypothetical protein [Candidatus Methanovirga basalitermitum]
MILIILKSPTYIKRENLRQYVGETDHVWTLKELSTFPLHRHKNVSS